jgi:hypothetical protein
MLNFLREDADVARLELTSEPDGSCRLVLRHADGSVAERFPSVNAAIKRVYEIEDAVARARRMACSVA